MTSKEFQSIIILLQDPDDTVYEHVSNKLISEGESIIPQLLNEKNKTDNEFLKSRIDDIIFDIKFSDTYYHLEKWIDTEENDLLKGAYLIEKIINPSLQFQNIFNEVTQLKRSIELNLNDNFTPLERVRAINFIFYKNNKFIADYTNNNFTDSFFVSKVLKSKRGSSIALAIIYLSLARKFGFPIYGVNLYKNFILAYVSETIQIGNKVANNSILLEEDKEQEHKILFYINPFNKGIVLGKKEIDFFLKNQKLKQKAIYYKPCSNSVIIKRLIETLIIIYTNTNKIEEAEIYKQVLEIFD